MGLRRPGRDLCGQAFADGLPRCSEQKAGKRCPHFSAGLSFGMRVAGNSLSDKELDPVVDEPLENGVCPWGSAPVLFKHHWDHATIQLIEVISMALAISSALGLLFSEKFACHRQARGHGVYAHVKPAFGTRWLYDVQISPVDGSNTARGRFSPLQGLTWNKHVLLRLCS